MPDLTLLRHAVQKPPLGPLKLVAGHPLAQGLVGSWLFNDFGSSPASVVNPHDQLAITGANPWGSSIEGPAVNMAAAPQQLRLASPSSALLSTSTATLYWRGVILGAGGGSTLPRLFSIEANNTNASPFIGIGIYRETTGNLSVGLDPGGAGATLISNVVSSPPTNTVIDLAVVFNSATGTTVYYNGSQVATNATTGALSYTSTACLISNGISNGTGDTTNHANICAHIYNRALTAAEVGQLHAEPYAMFQARPVQKWFVLAGASTTPSGADSATLADTATLSSSTSTADSATLTDSASLSAAVSTPESGTVTETGTPSASTSATETATAAETGTIAASISTTDAATLAEQVSIAAATAGQDTAALAEQLKIALQATDGAGLAESFQLALSQQDTATLHELVSVALAIADAASLGESASVTQQGANPTASDAASIADTASIAAQTSAAEIGALAEQTTIGLSATESASVAEQVANALLAGPEGASVIEQYQVAVSATPIDLASVQEAVQLAVQLTVSDSASLGESQSVAIAGISSIPFKTFVTAARVLTFVAATRSLTFDARLRVLTFTAGVP